MSQPAATERLAQLVLYCLAIGAVLIGAWATLCGGVITLVIVAAVFARYAL